MMTDQHDAEAFCFLSVYFLDLYFFTLLKSAKRHPTWRPKMSAASTFNTLCVATKDTLRLIANVPSQIIQDWRLVNRTPELRDSADLTGFVGLLATGLVATAFSAHQKTQIISSTALVIGSIFTGTPDLLEKGLSMYPPLDMTKLAIISGQGLAFSLAAQYALAKKYRQKQKAPSPV